MQLQQLVKIQLLISGAVFFLSGCNPSDKESGWSEETQIYNANADDSLMVAAQQKSRKTVGEFVTALTSGDTTMYNFGVKAAFPADGFQEHIWLSNLTVKGDSIYGAIDNEPEYTKTVSIGQRVAVHKDSITDWNYTKNNRLVGGYSIRVIRNRMSQKERAEFDKATEWQF
ncbi:DUF2314 domain-containing protein [Hymenobacter sp. BT635]|uniref:DUF2314 domain-containing protein n=1 Tax=Hymenobacter nitidus TaxID=2880929 RepID=A0ABS8AJ93_9BACT|nr:DUF2314 domain-containing protein [Hymenobacter nitidus]MCB2379325.1 DUF2314 domain-containing protein [Hymenobacter nitidus]